VGIYVEHLARVGHARTRRLRLVCEVPAQPSQPSQPSKPNWNAGSSRDGSNPCDGPTVTGKAQPSQTVTEKDNEVKGRDVRDGCDGLAGTLHTSEGEGGEGPDEGSPDRHERVVITIGAGTKEHRSFVSSPAPGGLSLDEWASRVRAAHGATATVRPAPRSDTKVSPAALAEMPPEDPDCPLWRISVVVPGDLSIEFDRRARWSVPEWALGLGVTSASRRRRY
jgi:hypothetical protein